MILPAAGSTSIAAGSTLIVGGGLAGAAAACQLAQQGQPVTLFERERQARHKVCGEFISVEADRHLAALGLDLASLGAVPIERVRIACRHALITSALPFAGSSLTRRRLDAALLAHAEAAGADTRQGCGVRRAVADGAGATLLELDGGERLGGRSVLLATGKHELRGLRRPPPSQDQVCFKSYFMLAAPSRRALDGHVELVLFRDGYGGLQMVEGGLANLCLVTTRARLTRDGGTWRNLLASLTAESPHLRSRLQHADECLDRPLTIARVPYGFLHRTAPEAPRDLFRLGDQMAVIPSFTGDGMAIALHTAAQAVRSVLGAEPAASYHDRMRRALGPQMRLAGGLYAIGRTVPGQAMMLLGARLWPGLVQRLASATRVPDHAGTLSPA
ncbi:FAD-dependent oxidoreductase [Lichenicoccus sp.]|uniref:FAD-dependent oxidoreductase n=1 Tax=Lichenicoccus sp. TaxID=2781899 RepID=UPI003D09E9CC